MGKDIFGETNVVEVFKFHLKKKKFSKMFCLVKFIFTCLILRADIIATLLSVNRSVVEGHILVTKIIKLEQPATVF